MFLTKEEMITHIYQGVMDEISRDDATKMDKAIAAAIEEARGYITPRYDDVAALTNAVDDGRNPILLLYVKDLAAWHFITVANPNIDMALRKERYDAAIDWFMRVQSGKVNPALPVPTPDADGNQPDTGIQFSSNPRRDNQF